LSGPLDEIDTDDELNIPLIYREIAGDHIIVLDEIEYHNLTREGLVEKLSDIVFDPESKGFFHIYNENAEIPLKVQEDRLLQINLMSSRGGVPFELEYDKQVELRKGEIVFPTSSLTVAFGVFSFFAADTSDSPVRDLGFGILNEKYDTMKTENKEDEFPSIVAMLSVGAKLLTLKDQVEVGTEKIGLFTGESDGDDFTYFSPKIVDSDGKGLPITKAFKDRLMRMVDLRPDNKGKSNNKIMSGQGLSPITQFYFMRYMGAYLANEGYANQAVPKSTEGTLKLDRIRITRENQTEMVEQLRKLVEGDVGESNLDSMFPFERLRTIYRYPDDYSREWRNDNREERKFNGAVEPYPWNPEVRKSLRYGLLQKLYTNLKRADKEKFLEAVVSQIYETVPKEIIPLPAPYRPNSMELDFGGADEVSLPRLNDSYLIGEALKAFSEIDPTDSSTDSLKLRIQANDPQSRQVISDGAEITIPGWLVLTAEKSRQHKWVSLLMSYPNYNEVGIPSASGRGLIASTTGMDHVVDVMTYYENYAGDVGYERENLFSSLSEEYDFVVATVGDTVQATYISDEFVATLMLDRKVLEKGLVASDFKKLNEQLKSDPADDDPIDQKFIVYGEGVELKRGNDIEPALIAYASDTGLSTDSLNPSEARSFNSLGFIVEEMMVNSGMQAISTAENVTSVSDFDRIVLALIGTNKYPGLCVSHSILHYQYLLAMTLNPIKNYQAIDSQIFQQGSVLALESFFADPAKKTLYQQLNDKGFIDVGDFSGTRPRFFRTPQSLRTSEARFVGLLNSFSLIVISYYRLMFAQIRNRMVVNRKTKAKGRISEETIGISSLWREMIADAERNTPSPEVFGLILRWFSDANDPVLSIPTWMPVMPSNMKSEAKKLNASDVWNYLKWAYSTNSIDTEFFAEVAAAYHASKVLSYLETDKYDVSYADVIERFVDSVDEDMGHAFLFAILIDKDCPTPMVERAEVSDIFVIEILSKAKGEPEASSAPPASPASPASPAPPASPASPQPASPPQLEPESPVTVPESTEGKAVFNQIIDLMKEFLITGDMGELNNLIQRLSNEDQREKANKYARTGEASEVTSKSWTLTGLDTALAEANKPNIQWDKVQTAMEKALETGGFL